MPLYQVIVGAGTPVAAQRNMKGTPDAVISVLVRFVSQILGGSKSETKFSIVLT